MPPLVTLLSLTGLWLICFAILVRWNTYRYGSCGNSNISSRSSMRPVVGGNGRGCAMAWRHYAVERGPRPKVYKHRVASPVPGGGVCYRYVYLSKSSTWGPVDLTCATGNPPPGFEVVDETGDIDNADQCDS